MDTTDFRQGNMVMSSGRLQKIEAIGKGLR